MMEIKYNDKVCNEACALVDTNEGTVTLFVKNEDYDEYKFNIAENDIRVSILIDCKNVGENQKTDYELLKQQYIALCKAIMNKNKHIQ